MAAWTWSAASTARTLQARYVLPVPTVARDDGVVIAAHDLGGQGEDALLAHATGFHGRVWLPVAALLRTRLRCLAVDERGHGDSRVPPGAGFDWRTMADDLLAVVDETGLRRPFGVGHSAGAALLLLAEQARPGTFAALWCFEPIVPLADHAPSPEARARLVAGARERREVFSSRDEAYEHYAPRPPFSAFAPDALRAYVDHGFDDLDDGSVRLKCRGEHEARIYENGMSHGAGERLELVRCPVTVAYGERTRHIGPAAARALADGLPHGRAEALAALGHFGPLEDPEAAAASVLRAAADVGVPRGLL